MPRREKIVICILMGLGILASCAAIPKFLAVRRLGHSGDATWEVGQVDMWSLVEISLGILATSNIALKGLLEKLLRRFKLLSTPAGVPTTANLSPKAFTSRGKSGAYGESTEHVITTEFRESTGDSIELESQKHFSKS
jgi:hypothetical protein